MNTTTPWRKSSRSPGSNGNCVEARLHGHNPQLSDSKLTPNRPILVVGRDDYRGLIAELKSV